VSKARVLSLANTLAASRYPGARAVFAAGSIVRGEGTAFSDLDLVVVHESLTCAYRESFGFEGLPVEAFVHDPETARYFFLEVDRPSGVPALPQMIVEGVEIPGPTEMSQSLKVLAASVIAMGPPPWTPAQHRQGRYAVTDILDDLRAPRSPDELKATGAQLFETLADYHLRANGLWSARGKAIPRALARVDPALCKRYCQSFDELFTQGNQASVIELSEDILRPHGGPLFDGHRLDAPADWRRPVE